MKKGNDFATNNLLAAACRLHITDSCDLPVFIFFYYDKGAPHAALRAT